MELSIGLQISLLLFFALLGYLIALRINQCAVIGVIIIGIIAGPSFLELIEYNEFVKALAQMGAIILLFAIGLEFKLRDVYTKEYAFIAFGGVVVPWIMGYFLAVFFGYSFIESVLIGTAIVATSIAITASVLLEMGKLNTPTAKAIIGAAVVDDILSLIILCIAVQMTHGIADFSGMFVMAIKAVSFVAAGIFAGKYIRELFVKLDEKDIAKKFPDFLFMTAMMMAFFYSFLAEAMELSGIIGAFIAGSTLSGIKFKKSRDLKEGAEYLHVIFAAVFFISLGILTDLHLVSIDIILFLAALIAVAVVSKIIGCYVPAKMLGMNSNEALTVGVGMIPRGEVGMIVGLIGLTSGAISQPVYVSIIIMGIATTLITPLVLRKLYRTE